MCTLYAKSLKMIKARPFYVSDKCKNHRNCVNELACPAFYVENEKVKIDPDMCVGCAVCAQICPENAILPLKNKIMKKIIIGVMGGGSASDKNMENARQLGRLIAESGWVLLNGGRNAGIMEASARGAKEAEGLTIGILPDKNGSRASNYIDIQIRTGANDARNYYNVLSSDVIVACNGRAGTISEISLALKIKKMLF